MNYTAIAFLLGWVIYSWQIALALAFVCGVMGVFYCGALTGDADKKALTTFSWAVVIVSIIALSVMSSPLLDEDSDMPKMCGVIRC